MSAPAGTPTPGTSTPGTSTPGTSTPGTSTPGPPAAGSSIAGSSVPGSVLVLDGTTDADRRVLGGKAWSIQRMMALGVPVPPAFVLTTDVCRRYHAEGRRLPDDVWRRVPAALAELERVTGSVFGGVGGGGREGRDSEGRGSDEADERPLLVSVRSGAAASMPGMMDTVLNLGMTTRVERALARHGGDADFATDTRRRFEDQFRRVVGVRAPTDPLEQLRLAVHAVLDSWHSPRAVGYRERRGLSSDGGTAVTVQAMVFGNLDDRSGTGVLFSRNPLTGGPEAYGEWLPGGQGEDVVSGRADALGLDELAARLPGIHTALLAAAARLEADARDVQDVEFTVESGTLWLLQSRVATRSPEASVRHAALFGRTGLLTPAEALDRVDPDQVRALLVPRLDAGAVAGVRPLATGKPACPGLATGVVVTDSDEAADRAGRGEPVVLARPTTDPDDVAAMATAAAVLTELGGSASHAAVVCREMAVPCVVGCGPGTLATLNGLTVTVDATSGAVYPGRLPILDGPAADDPDLTALTAWARADLGLDTAGDRLDLAELLARRAARRRGDGR